MLSFPIVERRLDNGLRVIVSEDHLAPVVAVNLWYDVGSRHERPGRTGLAHLFEHLMFEGSRQVAAGEHFKLVGAAGGTLNATTSTERTNYFETLPSEHLDLALWLEADRLGGLLDGLSQETLDNQRDVVKNERRQSYDNQPYGDAFERLCRLLYPAGHPYHHMPIGSMDDLSEASLDDVRDFFRRHYSPSNCVLTIVGDVTPDVAYAAVERYFGGIPAGPGAEAPRDGTLAEPVPTGVREEVPATNIPAEAVYLAFRTPVDGDARMAALEVVEALLASGRGSVFTRELVRKEIASQAAFFIDARRSGASLAVAVAHARAGVPVEQVESAMLAALRRLGTDGPTPEEVERAKAMTERAWLDQVATVDGRADVISYCATVHDDARMILGWLDRIAAVTADDVRDVVNTFFVGAEPVAVVFRPTAEVAA